MPGPVTFTFLPRHSSLTLTDARTQHRSQDRAKVHILCHARQPLLHRLSRFAGTLILPSWSCLRLALAATTTRKRCLFTNEIACCRETTQTWLPIRVCSLFLPLLTFFFAHVRPFPCQDSSGWELACQGRARTYPVFGAAHHLGCLSFEALDIMAQSVADIVLLLGKAAAECISDDALIHLKSYKYSSVDKSPVSKYILGPWVRGTLFFLCRGGWPPLLHSKFSTPELCYVG